MPDLLLELFSEEIPARMQRRAAADLKRLVTDALVEAGLVYDGAKAFATPRRLALTVHGVPARSPDSREERKGPRVGAPEKAIAGFLKAAGLSSIGEAEVRDDGKGGFYVAVIDRSGRPAAGLIAEIVPKVVRSFPWPKSMRWGEASAKPGALAWVRPLHSILCVFGPETEAAEVIDFEVGGVRSGDVTFGHRFMAPEPIRVRRFDDYVTKLEKAKVVLDADRRKEIILADARDRALALGLELIEDEGLLEEVTGLVEWPVVLTGSFDEAFLDIPPEVVRTTIRVNQKCFVLHPPLEGEGRRAAPGWGGEGKEDSTPSRRASPVDLPPPNSGAPEFGIKGGRSRIHPTSGGGGGASRLSNRFILVANIEAPDGGKAIVAGNERVINARLADAHYFWRTDRGPLPGYADKGKPLDQRLAKLRAQNIVFHEKLGTQGERVERIVRLAKEIAPLVGADPAKAERAASLAKANLMTEMVGEFPELQGLMGRYYALAQGEDPSVAAAIEDHYKPVGPSDRVPTDPVAIAVALADKLDMLVGFWAIDEKPTGSKDPYALRRAALGVIRIVLENELRVDLWQPLASSISAYLAQGNELVAAAVDGWIEEAAHPETARETMHKVAAAFGVSGLQDFFRDRLQVQLRQQGARHDLVDAVFALPEQRDLHLIVRRVEALGKFLDTDDGRSLLVGYRRATNILREEEKKSGETYDGDIEPKLLSEPTERALFEAIGAAEGEVKAAVEVEDFADAMRALAKLRAPVDAFFDRVLVNAPDPAVRANRLRLLNRIRQATLAVADFSRIGG